jgi:hypothetical protein
MWLHFLRVLLVLTHWSLIFVGFNKVSSVHVDEPRRTPPPPDVQQWTYTVNPSCMFANQTDEIMRTVHCEGGSEWRDGCAFRFYGGVSLNPWWVSLGVAFAVLSSVYAFFALGVTCCANDHLPSTERSRAEDPTLRCVENTFALSHPKGSLLAHAMMTCVGIALIVGHRRASPMLRCAPLGPNYDSGVRILPWF